MTWEYHSPARLWWRNVLTLACVGFCVASTYSDVASNVCVNYEVVENTGAQSRTKLTLENTGTGSIERGDWQMYFCSTRLVSGVSHNVSIVVSHMRISHVNGCMFKMVPESEFSPIAAGEKRVLDFMVDTWVVARTDVMANWYVTNISGDYAVIPCTGGEALDFVSPFNDPKQYKRAPSDSCSPFTPEERYELYQEYQEPEVEYDPARTVIPFPAQVSWNSDHVVNFNTSDWVVVANPDYMTEVELLALMLQLPVVEEAPMWRYITVGISLDIPIRNLNCADEVDLYRITVATTESSDHVIIEGASTTALFYGIQSFSMLVKGNHMHSQTSQLLGGSVIDCPRFSYRGVMVDVARNFVPAETIHTLIRHMGRYKLNKLHLHLTDDEGWRLEIPGLPELTRIGASRCHDVTETVCIMPQLGSNPAGGDQGSGFYSEGEYQDILRTAVENHVEVIPEIDLPGHAHAAIKAMQLRANQTDSRDFLLSDPDDTSSYLSVQMFTDNAVNPCIESTYSFVRHVAEAVKEMHQSIQPLKIFHFGGDEVANGAWLGSPLCEGHNKTELKLNFTQRVTQDLAALGLALGAWEDGVADEHSNPYDITTLTDDITAYAWSNIWEWGQGDRAYRLANAGYKVVLSHASHLYFDHPHEPDPEERGYYWAVRYTPTQKTFSYSPADIYTTLETDRLCNAITKDDICAAHSCVALEDAEKIIGIQAQVWSETVRTPSQLTQMLWPRLLAVAERAWHQGDWEAVQDVTERQDKLDADWKTFAHVVANVHLPALEEYPSFNYSVRPAGVRLVPDTTKLEALAEFPGMPLVVKRGGSSTWEDFLPDTEFTAGEKVELAVESFDRGQRSLPVGFQIPSGAGLAMPSVFALVVALLAIFIVRRE